MKSTKLLPISGRKFTKKTCPAEENSKETSSTLRQKSYEEQTIINTLENTESSKSLAYINNSNNKDKNNDQS